jgi:translocation and assembly module TamA
MSAILGKSGLAPAVSQPVFRRLCALPLALVLGWAPPAAAQGVKYRVEIDAPGRFTEVLRANLDIVRWSEREDVTVDQLRQLARTAPEQARDVLATEGYFSAAAAVELAEEQNRWLARLKINPGEPTRVVARELRLQGAIGADAAREARSRAALEAFNLKDGAVFRQADWDGAKKRALHSVQRSRYAGARIAQSRAEIDPESRQARLLLEIDSGPPFVFGELEVGGLQRYPLSTVRNLSPIRPGDPYEEEALLKFQRRLLNVGQFASAVVSAGTDPSQAQGTPVRVSVVEAAARRVELGAGYSTDRGPRFQAGYSDYNTLGRAWRFHSLLKLDRLSEQVIGGLTFPREQGGWRNGAEGKYNHQDIQGEQRTDWSVTGARTYSVEEYESQLALQLLEERQLLADGTEDNRKALFLSQAWTWNRLDDLLLPSRGYLVRLQVGGASESLGSDRSFGRMHSRGLYLLPVSDFGTLQFRLEAGAVHAQSRANIPAAYLFRTGGDTTVRGYAFESLGVLEGGATVGGRYMAAGSIEYIQWLTPAWGAAVFYDAGNAVDELSEFRAAEGYGIGARWRSPVGTLSLDIARGAQVDDIRVHFTVGLVLQ